MAYTDATQVSNFLQRPLNSYETAELTTVIAAVQKWLDAYLGSTSAQAGPTTRYYDGGVANLSIDPCTAISEVKSINDDASSSYTYTEGSEYIAEPQNQTVKNELRKRVSPFPRGAHRIAVTAAFSYYDGGIPADIQLVATRLAAAVLNAGKQASISGAGVKSESLEGHSITYSSGSSSSDGSSENLEGLANGDPTVSAILANYKELYIDDVEPRSSLNNFDDDDGGLMI